MSHKHTFELALAFSSRVRSELSAHLDEIVLRNQKPEYFKGCATHDFCDANMLMSAAFHDAFGREPVLPSDVDAGKESVHILDQDTTLWNSAWNLARAAGFSEQQLRDNIEDVVIKAAADAALDAGCLVIQQFLGVETGDYAGLYFSGPNQAAVEAILRDYLHAEQSQLSDD